MPRDAIQACDLAAATGSALPSVDTLARVLHCIFCPPLATIDPERCVSGWTLHLDIAAAILAALATRDTPATPEIKEDEYYSEDEYLKWHAGIISTGP